VDSLVFQLVRALLAFAGVLGLVYLASRYARNYWPNGGASGDMEIDSAVQVGPKSRIVAVRFGRKAYVLGVSETSISLIDMVESIDVTDGEGGES